jgi:ATP-dependent protease HslVU (ClpYQ) peptidase subunit
MTCIAAVIHDGKVIMGGDSARVNDREELQLRKDSKVFKVGEYLIGVSGSWRVMQIIRYARLPWWGPYYSGDEYSWMHNNFLSCIKQLLKENDCTDTFEMLIGFRGRLFHLYGTEQVSEEIAAYEACGSGAQVARGAMQALAMHGKVWDKSVVLAALNAAERFCSSVRGPFTILEG